MSIDHSLSDLHSLIEVRPTGALVEEAAAPTTGLITITDTIMNSDVVVLEAREGACITLRLKEEEIFPNAVSKTDLQMVPAAGPASSGWRLATVARRIAASSSTLRVPEAQEWLGDTRTKMTEERGGAGRGIHPDHKPCLYF